MELENFTQFNHLHISSKTTFLHIYHTIPLYKLIPLWILGRMEISKEKSFYGNGLAMSVSAWDLKHQYSNENGQTDDGLAHEDKGIDGLG